MTTRANDLLDAEIERRDEMDALTRERAISRKLRRENALLKERLDTLTSLGAVKAKRPKSGVISKQKKVHSQVGLISDTHTHEVVDPERTRGLGNHNPDIGKERLERLFYETAKWWRVRSKWYSVPEIHLFLMGDYLVNSEMHHPDSFNATPLSPLQEMRSVLAILKGGIEHVAAKTDAAIHVTCVPGNHGRAGEKRFIREADYSHEHMIHLDLALHFDQTEVSVDAGPSMDKLVNVGGVKFFVTHGDPMLKGGAGLPGSFVRLHARCKTHAPDMDLLVVGHVHQAGWFPKFGFSNGCTVGFNEYAMKLKLEPEPPSQWGFLVSHEYRRVGTVWPVWFD